VVTGGANGIGRAVAKTFAYHGACVHILDIEREQAEATAKEITEAGRKAAAYLCDVSDRSVSRQSFARSSRETAFTSS
jgi:NAD(P)-dependent dehydrogenase (short-subunit alcohol dehydrogenase family)